MISAFLLREILNSLMLILKTPVLKIIFGVIYRPAECNNLHNIFSKVQHILHNISSEDKMRYAMGDFNINLLSIANSPISFLNIMYSFCFRQ